MNELAKSLSALIDSLNGGAKEAAEALARTAPEAWRLLVLRVQIEAGLTMLLLGAVAACAAYGARRLFRSARIEPRYSGDPAEYCGETLFSGYLVTAIALAFAASALDALPDLFAPEVTAAERLLRAVLR